MRKVKGKNNNVLSDEYRAFGKDMESAVSEFSRVEACTKVVNVDMSLMTFLSPVDEADGDTLHTVHLDGEQQIAWNEETHSLSMDADFVDIRMPEDGPFRVEYPVLVTGGIWGNTVQASDEDLYFLSNAALHQLQKTTSTPFIGRKARNLLRDCAFAYRCAEMMEERQEAIIYREKDGIKKVVGCYETRPDMPQLTDILEAANFASEKTERCYVIDKWEITQYFRKVHFTDVSGEEKHELEYVWSDCGQKGLTVTSHVKGGKVKPKLKALKEASVTAALAAM